MNRQRSYLVLLLLVAVCFSLATLIQPRADRLTNRYGKDSVLKVLLGDGRRLFANHFFVKADVYFHSGYYPGIFDQAQAPKDSRHMTRQDDEHNDGPADGHADGHDDGHGHEADEHERQMAFLGPPRDWIERFGRNFIITDHTHLQGNQEREILPWLRISAELDPQRIDTYTVASYWLRKSLGKPEEAEKFLREGVRNNPDSYELLFELGRLFLENYQQPTRARDLWELALRKWHKQNDNAKEPDSMALELITVHLARVEEDAGNYDKAIKYLSMAVKVSPAPGALEKQIADLRSKLTPK